MCEHLASTKLVGVSSDNCLLLWVSILNAYGGVRVIKKGAVNVVLIIKFIQCLYNLQRHLGCSPSHQLYRTQHLVIPQIHQ